MELTTDNVHSVLKDCLLRSDEDASKQVKVEGIQNVFGFNQERLEKHRSAIKEMLAQLPHEFRKSFGGGGWSFLMACNTQDGNHWGEHADMEALFCLGVALNEAKLVFPRNVWNSLFGGMPYYVIMQ